MFVEKTYERAEAVKDGVGAWRASRLVLEWTRGNVWFTAEDERVVWTGIHGQVVDGGVWGYRSNGVWCGGRADGCTCSGGDL